MRVEGTLKLLAIIARFRQADVRCDDASCYCDQQQGRIKSEALMSASGSKAPF